MSAWVSGLKRARGAGFPSDLDEAQALYDAYKVRYKAQLPGTRGTHPDPHAPIDKITRTGKRYIQFHAFLRAMLYHELKATE